MLHLFGAKLRLLRSQQHLSQAALVRLLTPASRAHINNLEAGRRVPSLDLVLKIARIFGVSIDYLLRDTIAPEAYASHRSLYPDEPQAQAHLFGNKLRALRLSRALTQIDLSRQLELQTQAHISLLESGRSEPSLALVLKVADIFGVTLDYLLRDDVFIQDEPM